MEERFDGNKFTVLTTTANVSVEPFYKSNALDFAIREYGGLVGARLGRLFSRLLNNGRFFVQRHFDDSILSNSI